MDAEKFGRKIKYWREKRGYTQEALAAKTKISRVIISRIENGRLSPRLEDVETLLKALNVSMIINKKRGG